MPTTFGTFGGPARLRLGVSLLPLSRSAKNAMIPPTTSRSTMSQIHQYSRYQGGGTPGGPGGGSPGPGGGSGG